MDFGLSVGLSPRLTQDGFSFSGGLTPWLSAMPAGPESELYFSALVSIDYGDEAWTYSIEPQRFDVLFRPAPGTSIRVGRQAWSDSAGLVASGFFDGFTAQTLWGRARISLASLYTGLMLKGSSNVLMSNADLADRDDGSVGFAPARSVMALTMSVPGAVSFFADTIAQFDARRSEEHTF